MAHRNCNLCDRFIISKSVDFKCDKLIITIPAGCYCDGENYCFVVAQNIPDDTTIKAKVLINIEGGSELYPLVGCRCVPITACAIRTRSKYSVKVNTGIDTGVFRLLGKPYCCYPPTTLSCLDGSSVKKEKVAVNSNKQ